VWYPSSDDEQAKRSPLVAEPRTSTGRFLPVVVLAGALFHSVSFYRRWKTKETLVVETLRVRTQEELPIPDTGALRSDLIELRHEVIRLLRSPVGWAMVQVGVLTKPRASFAYSRQFYWMGRLEQFRSIVERAIARGELPTQTEPLLLLETVIGSVYVRLLLTDEPLDEKLPEQIVHLVLDGARSHEQRMS
jgi:Tetracyclin repressor-like, C-terminal domain